MAKNFKWFGARVTKKIEDATERALEKTAIAITNTIKEIMREPKSGILRSRGKRVISRSSASGEPPAVQTGRLRASIAHKKPAPLTRHIGTNVVYGRHLEIGTSRMKARPFLRPSLDRNRDRLEKFMRNVI